MTKIYKKAYMGSEIIDAENANLNIASSAVLYGLSVYTVFPILEINNELFAFRLKDHFERLIKSAKIIGIDQFEKEWDFEKFKKVIKELIKTNEINENVFVRATVHVNEVLPGTKSRGIKTTLSIFIYEAKPIIPQNGARIKTSVWRRTPDYSIPSRAKVNGAYINSVLGKQDAIDSGYDDCLFLDIDGHVCELSAANIFIVRDGTLITPGRSSDILEGISRKTILELAERLEIKTIEREIDLTELYIADEVFACGTSSFIAPIAEIDARKIGSTNNKTNTGSITQKIRDAYSSIMKGELKGYESYLSKIN